MEGHAEVGTDPRSIDPETGKPKNGTLKYQLTDPRTAAEFAPLWDKASNNWTVLDNVKAWTNEGGVQTRGGPNKQGINGSVFPGVDGVDAHFGSLTVGYGCNDGNGGAQSNLIGPEYGFGFGLQDAASSLKGQKILIVKTAWGGKLKSWPTAALPCTLCRLGPLLWTGALGCAGHCITNETDPPRAMAFDVTAGKTLAADYRPPSSSGPTVWCNGAECPRGTGHFYTTMMADVAGIMAPGVIGKMFPELAQLTPELAGFGWHQVPRDWHQETAFE